VRNIPSSAAGRATETTKTREAAAIAREDRFGAGEAMTYPTLHPRVRGPNVKAMMINPFPENRKR
jgi:hypothetical protein